MGFLDRKFRHVEETEREDILRNITRVLGAKRGGSAYFPDFGLSEPTHASTEEGVLRFTEEIRAALKRYEPRVRVLEIEEAYDDNDRLRLEVHLELVRTGARLDLEVNPRARTAQEPPPEAPEEG